MRRALQLLAAAALAGLLLATTGCEDEPYCFDDCNTDGSGGASDGGSGSGNADGGNLFGNGGMDTGGGSNCELTNAGIEICDEIDNDCDGSIDEDIDFNSILTCGTCANSCFAKLLNADPNTITCDWDGSAMTEGTCSFTDCASDYFDIDGDGVDCEYYCVKTADDDTLCNNRDDDCDGVKDEDVDLCTDATNCGACGAACAVVHGTGKCVDLGQTPCSPANTQCEIDTCDDDDNDSSPDWWDVDGSYATGCEYPCSLTNGGIEICGDGIDNDCDGAIDSADSDLSGDPQLNQICYGDPDGECALSSHAGLTDCVANTVVCVGANVLHQGDKPEICDGIDNDCNGLPDDFPIDAGSSCGLSNVFPCTLGTEQCINGSLSCVGNIDPQTDNCDGIDNDCDGGIDKINGGPPADAGGQCNVPIPPPANATSPCSAGSFACQGGVLLCTNWTGPTSSTDGCGDDSNCDGVLTGQPDLTSDVSHCGACNNDCYTGAVNSDWTCNSSTCTFAGCKPGFWDLDSNETCEYGPCTVTNNGVEICDTLDNDCDGLFDSADSDLSTPTPTDVCGVSIAATTPECTTGVSIACTSGTWACTFPHVDVCTPNCQAEPEICDTYDNDCDGGFNENVGNFGQACFSDGGLPPPGHGACRTAGTFVCNGPGATQCSATKGSCAPNCEELCDGIDNDCDGSVDETYLAKGTDTNYFVMPQVTQISNNRWMMSFEASRPSAEANSAGTGNGYHCASGCGTLPVAPPGEPLDETVACSVPDVLPWFNVTPIEVEQTCDAIDGFICTQADWQLACSTVNNCDWGYNPSGAACQSQQTGSKYCNLAAFDFDTQTVGIQDGLLATGSPALANCFADWTFFNQTDPELYDITGNLREITKSGSNIYPLLGGAFNTPDELGATCDFDFYVVVEDFALLDTGFRCCFSSDPRF